MSTTVDSKVVEMRFDNAQFERNVRTSMSTIDKLKQKLNFTESAKSLETLSNAANKTDFSGMTSGIETVSVKFSHMSATIQHQLDRIVDKAVNTGTRLAKSLSVDQVSSGWSKYGDKTTSVATLVAQGNALEDVNEQLDRLNWFTDETSYNFTDMVANIAKFTATGKDLNDSVTAMEGIANWAALSGQNASTASRAMYQISQALGAGYFRLEDYKSIQNASMDTEEFRQKALDAAVALGTLKKNTDGTYKSLVGGGDAFTISQFTNELTEGAWFTSDVMMKVFSEYSAAVDQIYEYSEEKGITASQAIEALGDDVDSFGLKAFKAAQEARTWGDAVDSVKDAVSTGWMKTFELIFGDAEEATALWTDLANIMYDIFASSGEIRNEILESALGKTFTELAQKVNNIINPVKKTANSLKNVADTAVEVTQSVADLGTIVDEVILGKFGNGTERFNKLTEAGVNWYRVQNEVNKKLGDSTRYTDEQIAAQDKLIASKKSTTASTTKETTSTGKLTKTQKENLKNLAKLTNKELEQNGYTKEQISSLRELTSVAEKLGMPFDDFIDQLDEINGRWILIDSFKNIGTSILEIFSAIKDGYSEIFDPITADSLFDMIAAFHKFTTKLIPSQKQLKNLTNTFKGLFSIVELVTTIFGGGLKIALQLFSSILSSVGMGILDFTGYVGNMITKLNDWLQDSIITRFVDAVAEKIPVVIESIKDFLDSINVGSGNASAFKTMCEGISAAIDIMYGRFSATFNSGIKIFGSILSIFGTNMGELVELIATYIIKARDWISTNTSMIGSIDKIANIIVAIINGLVTLGKKFFALKPVKAFIESISKSVVDFFNSIDTNIDSGFLDTILSGIETTVSNISSWLDKLNDSEQFGRDFVNGLIKGIASGITYVVQGVLNLATSIADTFTSFFGIHSPSRLAFTWGMNIITGFVNGIKAFFGLVDDTVTQVGTFMINMFKGFGITINDSFTKIFESVGMIWNNLMKLIQAIDFKMILAVIPVAIVALFAKKMYDLINVFADGIKGINGVISGFKDIESSIASTVKSIGTKIKAEAVLKLATSLAILVGAVIALAQVPAEDLIPAVTSLVILAGVLAGLAFAINKLDSGSAGLDLKNKSLNINGLKTTLIQLAASMIMLAGAVKILGSMKPEELTQGLIGLVGLMEGIALVVLSYGYLSSKLDSAGDFGQLGSTMLKLAVAMGLMVGVCKIAGSLTQDEMKTGGAFALAFLSFVAVLNIINMLFPASQIQGLASLILSISVSLALMVGVCKLAGMLTDKEMQKGAVFAVGFLAFVGILKVITQLFPAAQMQRVSLLMLSATVALGLMVGVCKLIGLLKWGEMGKAIAFAAGFLVFIGVLTAITTISSDEQTAKIAGTILAMSVAIGMLAGVCILMSLLTPEMLNKGLTAVTVFGLIMTVMIAATRGANDVKGSIMAMAVAIGVMAASVAVLSFIKTDKLMSAVLGLVSVMATFALMAKSSSGLGTSMTSLIVMTAMIGMMGLVIYKLASLDVKSSIGAAASISALLLSMAATMAILGTIHRIDTSSLVTIGILTLVTAALGGLLYLLRDLPMANTLGTVKSLSTLILALSAACILLEVAGLGGPAALIGINALTTLITSVGALLFVIGGLATKFDVVNEFLDNGIPVLEKIGYAIGSFVGNVIGGFSAGILSGLPSIGETLSKFMFSIQGFVLGSRIVDDKALNGIVNLVEMIALVTGASILDGIASFITGGTNIDSFKATVLEFADVIIELSKKLSGANIDSDAIVKVGTAGKSLAELEDSIPRQGGWIQDILGESKLDEFGKSCVAFGKAIIEFSETISGSTVDTEAIKSIASAGTSMADLEDAIPKTGGFVQDILGESKLGEFGKSCVAFGKAIVDLSSAVSGANIDKDAIHKAVDAGTKMAEFEDIIPKKGGLIQGILGESELGEFGKSCVAFGTAMTDFASSVSIDTEAVENAANAGKMMTTLDESIPDDHLFDGKVDLEKFGKKIASFGEGLVKYSNHVSGIDSESVSTSISQATRLANIAQAVDGIDSESLKVFTSIPDIGADIKEYSDNVSGIDTSMTAVSISFCQRLRDFMLTLGSVNTDAIYNFKLGWIGEAIKTYNDNTSGINTRTMSESITIAGQLRDFINSLSNMNGDGIGVFKQTLTDISNLNIEGAVTNLAGSSTALTSTGVQMINGLVNGMNSQTHTVKGVVNNLIQIMSDLFSSKTSLFKKLGNDFVAQMSMGISVKEYMIKSNVTSVLNSSKNEVRSYYSSFYDAGAYLSTGLANGIKSKLYTVRQSAIQLANAAETTTRAELEINSPSKLFRRIGSGIPEGLAQGIVMLGGKIKSAVGTMSGTALDGTKSAISKIYDYVNSDMDSEPTIRPVMDLSEVQSGINSLDGLFSGTRSIGLTSNLSAISTAMSEKNQNGNNAEVISAINRLNKTMSSTGNTNYTINGVNYSGESDVANAIKIITRAAIMEGRV